MAGELTSAIVPNQFGEGLSPAAAYAACGPAAAVAFARANGRNPTLAEAVELAKQVGWTPEQGMAGPASEKALLDQMGVPARLESTVDWEKVRADVDNGNPVIIDTPGHYFVVAGFDPSTGAYDVGASGTVYKGGKQWLTPGEMQQLAGAPRAALYLDNPTTPGPSIASEPVGTMENQPIDWTTQTAPLTRDQVNTIVAANGGKIVSNTVRKGTEMIADPEYPGVTALRKPNPNPTYEVVFGNGKMLLVQGERDAQGEATGSWLPVGGNALKPSTTKAPAGASSSGIWIDLGDGRRVRMQVGADGNLEPTLGPGGQPVVDQGGKTPPRGRTQAQEDASAAAAALSIARTRQVGQPTPLDPLTAALRQAQTTKAEIEAAKAAEALVPIVTRAVRDHDANTQSIAAQYVAGRMTLEQFQQAQDAADQFFNAAMKGTTPAEQEKQRQEQDARRAQIGKDLLNKQMEVAAENAKNAGADYRELLTNQHVVIPEQYDPMQRAGLLTAGMTGELGKQPLSEFARALLEPLLSRTAGASSDYPGVTPASLEHPDYPGVTPASLVGPDGEEAPA